MLKFIVAPILGEQRPVRITSPGDYGDIGSLRLRPITDFGLPQIGEATQRRRPCSTVQATLGEILGSVMSGKLSLQIGTVLPLSQAIEAHRLLEGRKTTGRVVLQPWVDA